MVFHVNLPAMSRIQAGVFLLLFFLTSGAFAQPTGEVETIGFNNQYRPDAWTPMLIRIQPGAEDTGTYQIQVFQEDMDRDRAIFTRTITLTGGSREQRFWAYFLPQPNKIALGVGLPDTTQGGTLKDLQENLKVYLCDEKGKQLAPLRVTSSITNIEAVGTNTHRDVKFILFVSDGRTQPIFREYSEAAGLVEDVQMISVQPRELPENVLGYDAIDAIIWSGATPPDPDVPADEPRMRAIQQYVRAGGKLVICQPIQWQQALSWGDMLPVTFPKYGDVQGVSQKDDLKPLRTMAEKSGRDTKDWDMPLGPFTFGIADAKPDAKVDDWIDWPGGAKTPYLVRKVYGAGETIWVANDLGDTAINSRARTGWAWIWDHVLDFKNDLKIYAKDDSDLKTKEYAPNAGVDLGGAILPGMELTSTSARLIGIAVIFFIAYWIIAGPGTYFYLLRLKRASMSWLVFGMAAVVATAVTMLVVRIVLRGAPEMRHVTLVRITPHSPAIAESRIGLYIKSDGLQTIALKGAVPDSVSLLSHFPIHPKQKNDASEFSANLEYAIPVHDAGAAEAIELHIPFRSTMKKLEARWVGDLPDGISGSPAIVPQNNQGISGKLTNATGKSLKNIYIVYNAPRFGNELRDFVLYYPRWKDGTSIDLAEDFPTNLVDFKTDKSTGRPEDNQTVWGMIGLPGRPIDWSEYWDKPLRQGFPQDIVLNEWGRTDVMRSFPMLSLFDRLGPMKNAAGASSKEDRAERDRRGARHWDVSPAISAGALVVLAQSEDNAPLPFPLEVNGSTVPGQGTVFYQFILPLDRSALDRPTTQPTTKSTTQE